MDQYAHLLRWQLSTIEKSNNPEVDLRVVVVMAPYLDDPLANDVYMEFASKKDTLWFDLQNLVCEPSELFQRACGRNKAVQTFESDVWWFTDCDYLFGDEVFKHAEFIVKFFEGDGYEGEVVFYPHTVNQNVNKEVGERLIQLSRDGCSLDVGLVNADQWQEAHYRKAIGGIQIVHNDAVKDKGYLAGTKWTKPLSEDEIMQGWRGCRCDRRFRTQVGSSQGVGIPNVYRIRHQERGRDQSYEMPAL